MNNREIVGVPFEDLIAMLMTAPTRNSLKEIQGKVDQDIVWILGFRNGIAGEDSASDSSTYHEGWECGQICNRKLKEVWQDTITAEELIEILTMEDVKASSVHDITWVYGFVMGFSCEEPTSQDENYVAGHKTGYDSFHRLKEVWPEQFDI